MRTGKLAISRGYQLPALEVEPAAPQLALVPRHDVPVEDEPDLPLPPLSPDFEFVHDRLSALERLTRLFEQGVLSVDEFVDEKALILGRRADELVLVDAAPVGFSPEAPRPPERGPSLLGRMLNWRFLLTSLVIGFGFSFAAQPDTTLHLFAQVARYLGA